MRTPLQRAASVTLWRWAAPLLLLALAHPALAAASIEVKVSSPRAVPGETVAITFHLAAGTKVALNGLQAKILRPSLGAAALPVEDRGAGTYIARYTVSKSAPQGLYAVEARSGRGDGSGPLGKATFLVGKITADFFEPSHLDPSNTAASLDGYLAEFSRLGGNLVIAHGIMTTDQAYFHCAICKSSPALRGSGDIVEMLLRQADARGIGVLFSVGWDMTHESPFQDRLAETDAIMRELYREYGQHPSFLGFYAYQEGSGLYYAPYIAKFTHMAKAVDTGLLTACAPYVDNPNLAGYLGSLHDLDIIIYQAMVMASYRPDNREHYPLRRAKDFCALSAGAKKLQNKIALTHVELFGYMENDIGSGFASYDNQDGQFLSVATVADNDGIALFAYQPLIYSRLNDPRAAESQRAVADGLRAFRIISSASAAPALLAAYVPYSDWAPERWRDSYLPAFDAFRRLGIPLGVLPYEPPADESLLPYYPFHLNPDVLNRLLRDGTVLVLPDVSGLQKTDSDLIRQFLEQGGVVIAFGPRIPTGVSYNRADIFGVEGRSVAEQQFVEIRSPAGTRAAAGRRIAFAPQRLPSWKTAGATVIASFDDGGAAVAVHNYGKGAAYTISPSATTAAAFFPALVRDVIDSALARKGRQRPVDILGSNDETDEAISPTNDGFSVAVVNHNATDLTITLQPLNAFSMRQGEWTDLAQGGARLAETNGQTLPVTIPAHGFRALEWKPAAASGHRVSSGREPGSGARDE